MGHYRKLYDQIKSNTKNVKFDDIDTLLTKVGGFNRRNPKSGSSHYTYWHSDLREILTIPNKTPVKECYVKKALELFDQVVGDF